MDEQPKPTVSLEPEALARLCVKICESGKAEDLMLFDVRESSILADDYLICTGASAPHLSGLCTATEPRSSVGPAGVTPPARRPGCREAAPPASAGRQHSNRNPVCS